MNEPRSLLSRPSAGGDEAPIDVEPQPSGRRSFWSRIALRRTPAAPAPGAPEAASPTQTLFSRLGAIEDKLEAVEASIDQASERLETRLLQFWEIEELLGQVSRRLAELESTQHDLAQRSARLSKSVTLLAVFALLAAAAALVIAFPLGQ